MQGYAEQYKDVIHEDAIKVSGATRAPDYCFRVGGTRKFFLEVKKPSVSISAEVGPAYQLRRYAWSARLPLGVVTDFEEFAVYDCRARPPAERQVQAWGGSCTSPTTNTSTAGTRFKAYSPRNQCCKDPLMDTSGNEKEARHQRGRRRVSQGDRGVARGAGA